MYIILTYFIIFFVFDMIYYYFITNFILDRNNEKKQAVKITQEMMIQEMANVLSSTQLVGVKLWILIQVFYFFSFLFSLLSSPLLSSLSHFLLFLPLFRYLILFISSLVSFFSADTRQSVTCMLLKGLTIQFPNSSEESIPPSSSLLPSLPPPYSLVSPLSPCDI